MIHRWTLQREGSKEGEWIPITSLEAKGYIQMGEALLAMNEEYELDGPNDLLSEIVDEGITVRIMYEEVSWHVETIPLTGADLMDRLGINV